MAPITPLFSQVVHQEEGRILHTQAEADLMMSIHQTGNNDDLHSANRIPHSDNYRTGPSRVANKHLGPEHRTPTEGPAFELVYRMLDL